MGNLDSDDDRARGRRREWVTLFVWISLIVAFVALCLWLNGWKL